MLANKPPSPSTRCRAPLRISFGGGGTDVPPYCDERGGLVLSATINRYAYATLTPQSEAFEVHSLDYDSSISYGIRDPFVYDGQLDLAKGVIDRFRREGLLGENGFRVVMHNDAPPGSGLGSSSAIVVALIGAISRHVGYPMDPYTAAQWAYEIERIDCKVVGGKQDQYAAAFGGFNVIEFHRDSTLVTPLRLDSELVAELEYRMVFAYVGGVRVYQDIVKRQQQNFTDGKVDAVDAMDNLKSLASEMKRSLLLGRLDEFGRLLDEGWTNKKRMASGISTPEIDTIYGTAREAGAYGGKVTGVGGGGFMFFVCDPYKAHAVQKAIRDLGCQVVTFSFSKHGLQAWKTIEG